MKWEEGGDCTFPYQSPRVLNSGKFDKYEIVHCNAPTQSLLQKWLREKHNKRVEVKSYFVTELMFFVSINTNLKDYQFDEEFLTYEEALEKGLYECLQIVSETVA